VIPYYCGFTTMFMYVLPVYQTDCSSDKIDASTRFRRDGDIGGYK
jgi:hypothetical protein